MLRSVSMCAATYYTVWKHLECTFNEGPLPSKCSPRRQVSDCFRKISLLEQQIWELELIEHWNPNSRATGSATGKLTREAWTTSQMCSCSCGRGSVGVEEHGVKGSGKVVGESAAVVVLWERHQTRHNQQQQEEDVEGESCSQDTVQERPRRGPISLIGPKPWTFKHFYTRCLGLAIDFFK